MVLSRVTELIGIYNADGGLRGEMRYVVGRLLTDVHCELCDITHSPWRRKKQWDAFAKELGVPFTLLHRNDVAAGSDIGAATRGDLPCVIARSSTGATVRVLDAADMAADDGDVAKFEKTLRRSLRDHDLALPGDARH